MGGTDELARQSSQGLGHSTAVPACSWYLAVPGRGLINAPCSFARSVSWCCRQLTGDSSGGVLAEAGRRRDAAMAFGSYEAHLSACTRKFNKSGFQRSWDFGLRPSATLFARVVRARGPMPPVMAVPVPKMGPARPTVSFSLLWASAADLEEECGQGRWEITAGDLTLCSAPPTDPHGRVPLPRRRQSRPSRDS